MALIPELECGKFRGDDYFVIASAMSTSRSIRDYFHVKDGLPDPQVSLSSELPSQAIARANEEVEKVLRETGKEVKRHQGKYNR